MVVEDEQVEEAGKFDIIHARRSHGYDICTQNIIILGEINEYRGQSLS
jgi:hypothetical protein